jgi:hypothetical protein
VHNRLGKLMLNCALALLCRRPYSFGKGNARTPSNPCSYLGPDGLFGAWRHQQWVE